MAKDGTMNPIRRHCSAFRILAMAVAVAHCEPGTNAAFPQEPSSEGRIAFQIAAPFAWSREDRYEPASFENFFPNDANGGRQLDLFLEGKLTISNVGERLALIRRGLRNTSHHRTRLLGTVGNEFIWNKEPQDPRAVELLDEHEGLDAGTVGAAIDTYQAVFDEPPPDIGRFDNVGKWVIAFHRTDLSATHPRAAKILRDALDHISLRNQQLQLIDFVTRVDKGHETAVALVQGFHSRTIVTRFLSDRVSYVIDFNEMLSPRILRERRLREIARYLPHGLPSGALPSYTRPPDGAEYAYSADEFVAPDYESFFADDPAASKQLDDVYANREEIALSDRELLELFRRGVRRSAHTPNTMFGWISGALGWPRDPLLTEILYQATDPRAPLKTRSAGIYYGFGLGTAKTRNILEAVFRVYMAPPFDRATNGNMRSRILWGVRDHEDDKHYLAARFADVSRKHSDLSDEALQQADAAYRQLTDEEPPNAAEYASRGVYLVMFRYPHSQSAGESKSRIERRLGDSPHLIEVKFIEREGELLAAAAVRGIAGRNWLVELLQADPKMAVFFVDLLTLQLINEAEMDILRDFARLLSASP